ncbi:hypothetical protein C8R42DRAFT_570096 [Lentinula raphanica]|nr:hypothetical protein C8R42DRAFT_570096 [Lentinula raphanica]
MSGSSYRAIPPSNDRWQSARLVRSGIIPTSPLKHSVGFTLRTISLYHKLFVRCPRLGVQPFSKAICDVEGVAFRPHLSSQLYDALDVYLAIVRGVRKRTREMLGRSSRDWRMLNSCPACQYQLKEDPKLAVRMIVTMDGNDSLKRVERKSDALQEKEENGVEILPRSREKIDRRVAGVEYFLSRAETDAWNESRWEALAAGAPELASSSNHTWLESQCEERWHNMQEKNTVKSSAKFFENGWFVLLCRHMIFLLACDMIKSGERAEYPLAILHSYMSAERDERIKQGQESPNGQLAVVYDIACKTSKTIARSPLAALARSSLYLPVIGTMHGYAHERACQLLFLMLYVVGVGLEDGEGCERYFNVSNALAPVTRYQSAFHRRQAIEEFIYYKDLETYSNISKFIYNNYKQALGVIRTRNTLRNSMIAAGISSADVFYDWLVEEGQYLQNLSKVPPKETLEMEYFLKLVALHSCRDHLQQARSAWLAYAPEKDTAAARRKINATEAAVRNEQENERKLIADIQALEQKLEISVRWVPGCEEWESARKAVKEAEYRKALDRLEQLLVSRIFEMSRLNVAGTGYKMRKMIATSLKTRSKSLQAAIAAYNTAAAALRPPRRAISWEEVVDYSFLSEFDILRDTREDVREKKWATPSNRLLMFRFFKLIRAEEELGRLHMEIKRLLTYIRDEERLFCSKADEIEDTNPALALQIRLHWKERSRYNDLHRQRLHAIKRLDGFDPTNCHHFFPGTPVGMEDVVLPTEENGELNGWMESDDGDDEEDEAFAHRVDIAMDLTIDD